MRFVDSGNALIIANTARIPEGNWGGYLFRAAGTNVAGQAVTNANVGRLRYHVNGEDIINVDFAILQILANYLMGFPEATSVVAGAFGFTAIIPTGLPKYPNNNLITRNDQAYVDYTSDFPNAGAAVPADATWSLYALPRDGVQAHFLKLHQLTQQPTGAGTFREKLPVKNVYSLLITTTVAANMSRVQVFVDDMIKFDSPWADGIALTSLEQRVEALQTVLYVPLARSNTPTEVLADNIEVQITVTGAATVVIYSLYYDYTPALFNSSSLYLANEVNKRIIRKGAVGATADVDITRRLRSPQIVTPPRAGTQ